MKNLVLFSAAVGVLLFSANGADASVIAFGGASGNISTYSELGFTFTRSGGGNMNLSSAAAPFPTDFLAYNEPAIVTLTAAGAAPFNLNSLNFAGFGSLFNITGNFTIGGPVSSSIATDSSLQAFSPGWTDLTSVVFSTSAAGVIGLDNVTVDLFSPPAAVPEPATASVLGLGTLVGAFCQYRRRRRAVAN